jgi:bacteriocin biosynthesis cyclodehydratase domain-containing protein
VRVGPTVVPGSTACVECSEARARAQHPLFDDLVAFRQSRPTRAATFGPACGLIGSVLATEAVHQLAQAAPPALLGRALVLDLRTLAVSWEETVPHRDCPGCALAPVS